MCGYLGYQISVYLLATAVCGYKGYQISVYLIISHGDVWLLIIPNLSIQYLGGVWL